MRVIIIGQDGSNVAKASLIAASDGIEVRCLSSLEAALGELAGGRGAELMLIDVRGDIRGASAALSAQRIHLPIVAFGTDCSAGEAAASIRAGARDFLPLPPEPELIAAILAAVAEDKRDAIFEDPAIAETYELARQVAPSDATVLITGESGTGKEVMARFVHRHSRRSDNALVCVNCAAIPDNLLESELFGHEKGAFTGAVSRRIGKFEEAHGGTLLLDEISEMDVRLQAKLLRAIQEREIDRVGGTRPVPVDIRLIATSNRDLAAAVAAGQFREDLLFRLNVVSLDLPPLRARPKDIELLARHFAGKHAANNGLPPRRLSAAAIQALLAHHWQGNVRELENCMHRAVLLARDNVIAPEHLRLPERRQPSPADQSPGASPAAAGLVGRTVSDVERELILETLDHTSGNRTQAATILGISIRTLRNKLHQYAAGAA